MDVDTERATPEPVLPEVSRSPVPKLRAVPPEPLPWGDSGNVVAAAGAVLLALMAGGA